jgi:HAE1 family hydrophobic/amphiphilic exporter-1
MNITTYSVKRPVTIAVLYALALGVAATLVPNIAVDLFPSTSRPVMSVYTSLPGAGPSDIELNVTIPIEKALASSHGLIELTSNSSFESSYINLSFAYGTDMDKAAQDAQTILNRIVNSLPDGATTPTVRRFDMSAMPIMRLVVRGNYPPDQLRIFAEDEIQSEVERVEGVASATVTGGTTKIIRVNVSLNRLAALGLTFSDVASSLRGQNILTSGGSLRRGDREYQILSEQQLTSIDQIKRLVVKTVNISNSAASVGNVTRSQVVRLEDIADIDWAYNDNAARVYVNGQSGVYIQVQKEDASNSVKVAKNVRDALEGINENLPRGITLELLSDNTSLISATMNQVYSNALQGALLAMLILFIFLRNIKGTFIIGLSIPISILLTLMCMAIAGFTLNLLTMTGLILGLGMTVDASIVILENVHNYRARGAKADIAAMLGSTEMFRAIVSSTTTTLLVFVPVIIYKNDLEMMGQMFNDLIFTIVISLGCSLFVAITLVPALCGSIVKLNTRKQKPLKNKLLRFLDDKMEAAFTRLDGAYTNALSYCLKHKLVLMLFVTALLVFSLIQFGGVGMNMYIRSRTDDSVDLNLAMPQGTPIEVTEKILLDIEEIVKGNIEGYRNIILTARRSGTNQGSIQITLPAPANQIDTPTDIQRKLTPLLAQIPEGRVTFRAGRNMGSTSAIDIAIKSRNNDAIMETAAEIQSIVARHLPIIENFKANLEEGAPKRAITVDRDRASALGISLSAIASEIRTAMDGTNVISINTNETGASSTAVNVQVRLRDEDRQGLPNLDAISVVARGGERITLSNVAAVAEGRAPSSVRRENQERLVRLQGDLPPGAASTEVTAQLKALLDEQLVVRDDVTLAYLGEAAEVAAYNKRFLFIIAAAIILVFGLMASQFESFVDPLIIFTSIPLLFIGVIWIYKIGNEAMSMFSMVGVVALVGVVVNTGIVLVDYTNTLRARGLPLLEACIEAGRNRLRPILMTTLTTVLGMVPIAFFPGAGADTIQPIGKTFVGGLTVSTVFSLFVTPVMYYILNTHNEKAKLRKRTGLED